MNATQKMIAAVAIVAVLAVAAVGAGFAYTASTSNTDNSADLVYFTLSQGENVSDYAESFNVEITYDTETYLDPNDPVGDVADATDATINAIPSVLAKKTVYEAAATEYVGAYKAIFGGTPTKISDMTEENLGKITTFNEAKAAYDEGDPTADETTAYCNAYNAIFGTSITEVSGMTEENLGKIVAINSAKAVYDLDVADYLEKYNMYNAEKKTEMSFNAVQQNGVDVQVVYFDNLTYKPTTPLDNAAGEYVVAYNAIFGTSITEVSEMTEANLGKITAFNEAKAAYDEGDPTADETTAYCNAYNAIFGTSITEVSGMTGENLGKITTLNTKAEAYQAQVVIFDGYTKAYVLSGATGKQFTVSSTETAIPQYKFGVSADDANMDTEHYGFIVGVAFAANAGMDVMTFQEFTGTEKTFNSSATGKGNITFGLYLFEKGGAGPADYPFQNLDFDFVIDTEVA